mmetsp:Transcript_61370/g.105642  ORF Transcript_61370/g.105642 Transcript_61370/m.105642 type:complete len:207 (-) Transcript_61370:77-697(-)
MSSPSLIEFVRGPPNGSEDSPPPPPKDDDDDDGVALELKGELAAGVAAADAGPEETPANWSTAGRSTFQICDRESAAAFACVGSWPLMAVFRSATAFSRAPTAVRSTLDGTLGSEGEAAAAAAAEEEAVATAAVLVEGAVGKTAVAAAAGGAGEAATGGGACSFLRGRGASICFGRGGGAHASSLSPPHTPPVPPPPPTPTFPPAE